VNLCSPQISIAPESPLGGCVYDREILKALAALGVSVTIPLPVDEPHENVTNWKIARVRRHRWKYYEYNLIFRRAVKHLIDTGRKPDIIRAHSVHSVGVGLLGLARHHRIPIHLHYHHWERHRLRNLIERNTIHRYDLVTTDSHWARRDLLSRFPSVNPDRVHVVYPGITKQVPLPPPYEAPPWVTTSGRVIERTPSNVLHRHSAIRVQGHARTYHAIDFPFSKQKPDILLMTLGVSIHRKNHAFLLPMFKRVLEFFPSAVLVLGDNGPCSDLLAEEVMLQGIEDNVWFVSQLKEPDKWEYLRLCDIFLMPSKVEGFGISAVEAMSCGKPVIVSDRGALPEVVRNAGISLSLDCEGDWVSAINRLLRSKTERQALGEAAKRRAADFSFERSAAKLAGLYRGLLL
jgi:glycosyltransferase involved in cell wall biosynthesis